MLEAFERHLTSIDISRKFEAAKTNEDKIKVCKEFLEKQGFEVKFKPKFPDEDEIERAWNRQTKAPMKNPFEPSTWVSDNTYSRPTGGSGSSYPNIQAKGAKVLQSQYIMSDDMIRNYPPDVIPEHVKDKLLSQVLPEIIDHAVFVMATEPYDFSLRAKLKIGVFKP